jgi:hypothetical protein
LEGVQFGGDIVLRARSFFDWKLHLLCLHYFRSKTCLPRMHVEHQII